VNKALLDTDIYSEVLKAKNPSVAQNAAAYRQQHGVYTVVNADRKPWRAADRKPWRQ
jgi:hypothetical protein